MNPRTLRSPDSGLSTVAHRIEEMRRELCTLSEVELGDLNFGVNCISKSGFSLLILKRKDGTLQACENLCKHQGGKFALSSDIEDAGKNIVKCTRHHWKLDCETLQYVNPPQTHYQEPLLIRHNGDGSATLSKHVTSPPWIETLTRSELVKGEMTITYLSHACLEFKLGKHVLVSDPWLVGPAFLRGWWLKHVPPAKAIERVCRADAIWISHGHSDHMNAHTLRLIAKRRPDIPVFVGKLTEPILPDDVVKDVGFTNVKVIKTGEWHHFDETSRFMINTDDTLPEVDTWILLEHRGHRVLNFVDCSAPSAFELPSEQVDVILTDFASGASGYPSCFADMYGKKKVVELANTKRKLFLRKLTDLTRLTKAKAYIPMAGYFTAAHPSDADIRNLNKQNTPAEAIQYLKKVQPHIKAWLPYPGGRFDVSNLSGDISPDESEYTCTSWDFSSYISQIDAVASRAMSTGSLVQQYFDWSGFANYDLVLHIIETDEEFKNTIREFFIDFNTKRPEVVTHRPRQGNCLRMRVRSTSFRYVLHTGSSWDDLFIGFQARIHASPDIYHFKFYNHFSNILPRQVPRFQLTEQPLRSAVMSIPSLCILHIFIFVLAAIYVICK